MFPSLNLPVYSSSDHRTIYGSWSSNLLYRHTLWWTTAMRYLGYILNCVYTLTYLFTYLLTYFSIVGSAWLLDSFHCRAHQTASISSELTHQFDYNRLKYNVVCHNNKHLIEYSLIQLCGTAATSSVAIGKLPAINHQAHLIVLNCDAMWCYCSAIVRGITMTPSCPIDSYKTSPFYLCYSKQRQQSMIFSVMTCF